MHTIQLVLCTQEALKINKAYHINGKTPLFDNDAQIDIEDGIPFYPMFKVRDIDDSHLDFRSILVWNGKNYMPFIRIVPAKSMPDKPTQLLPPKYGDLLVVDPHNLDHVYALMAKRNKKERMAGWDVQVAPGIDVGMMMAVAVIMDDMVGWFS
jgi:hypothetical protein